MHARDDTKILYRCRARLACGHHGKWRTTTAVKTLQSDFIFITMVQVGLLSVMNVHSIVLRGQLKKSVVVGILIGSDVQFVCSYQIRNLFVPFSSTQFGEQNIPTILLYASASVLPFYLTSNISS